MIKILEVGPRTAPVVQDIKPEYISGGGDIYLVDKRHWAKDAGFTENPDCRKPYAQSDAQELSFRNSEFDVVLEKDVFCSDGHWTWDPEKHTVVERRGDIDKIVNEMARVTKGGGTVIAIETLTVSPFLFDRLTESAAKAGLTVEKVLKNHDALSVFVKEPAAYSTFTGNAFSCVLRKK